MTAKFGSFLLDQVAQVYSENHSVPSSFSNDGKVVFPLRSMVIDSILIHLRVGLQCSLTKQDFVVQS